MDLGVNFCCRLDNISEWVQTKITREGTAFMWNLHCGKVICTASAVWITSNVYPLYVLFMQCKFKVKTKISILT